jgi:hypothetical protein
MFMALKITYKDDDFKELKYSELVIPVECPWPYLLRNLELER